MFQILRSTVGFLAIVGFSFAVVLLMLAEWKRIKSRRPGFVPLFHRVRRIVTGFLMIVLLGFCFYGWWFMHDTATIQSARLYLKTVFTLFSIILLSLLWDCVAVYRSMDTFFERMNQSAKSLEIDEDVIEESKEHTMESGAKDSSDS